MGGEIPRQTVIDSVSKATCEHLWELIELMECTGTRERHLAHLVR